MEHLLEELVRRYPLLAAVVPALRETISAVIGLYRRDGTLFVAGNGGSGADAEHICGELLKGFKSLRPLAETERAALKTAGDDTGTIGQKLQQGLRAVSLLSHPGLITAFANDVDASLVYAQQLWALGRKGDILLGISTGGGAENIRAAFIAARAKGIKTILLTGSRHGVCENYADVVIAAPESETYKIQELHLPIYHTLCLAVEREFFPGEK